MRNDIRVKVKAVKESQERRERREGVTTEKRRGELGVGRWVTPGNAMNDGGGNGYTLGFLTIITPITLLSYNVEMCQYNK